ncbi:MAG: hypothetical protein M3315_11400 [Actinomycetota bacterium]|nr:hypothetical protein [Actinomycetota bacterium]
MERGRDPVSNPTLAANRCTYGLLNLSSAWSIGSFSSSPKILVSGFGPKAIGLAGPVGDGYCGVSPDDELVSLFRSSGGDKPAQAGMKVC